MKVREKKGLSEVVTSLILILLVLVAIGIIWVVIRNVIETGSEEISTGKFTIDLDLKKVVVNPNSLDVTIKRNAGVGELQGLAFSIHDGSQSKVVELNNIDLKELEEKTFNVPYSGLVKEISASPIVKTSDGKGLLGNPQTNLQFSTKDALKNVGVVSWWRFEGNANDEIGGNHGIPLDVNLTDSDGSTPPQIVSGKFGNGYSFDGRGDFINVSNDSSLDLTNGLTLAIWAYQMRGINNTDKALITKDDNTNPSTGLGSYTLLHGFGNDIYLRIFTTSLNPSFGSSSTYNQWHHLVGTYNGSKMSIYVDGSLKNQIDFSGAIRISTHSLKIGGDADASQSYNPVNGTLDEAMIFNRALSPEEIQSLYNLDMST